jgi:glycosyltransferase involved in cell wall biosynthesis
MICKDTNGKSNTLKLIALGTIISRKNVKGLISALAIYKKRCGENVKVSWAGKQDQTKQGRAYYKEACNLIAELGVDSLWEWLGECSNIAKLLPNYDALIHPSFHEGMPNAVCEALAIGKPVLVSKVCDHPLIVKDGLTGFLFDPYRPEDIAKAVHTLTKLTPDEYLKMGIEARAYAENKLSMEFCASQYENLLEYLTSRF